MAGSNAAGVRPRGMLLWLARIIVIFVRFQAAGNTIYRKPAADGFNYRTGLQILLDAEKIICTMVLDTNQMQAPLNRSMSLDSTSFTEQVLTLKKTEFIMHIKKFIMISLIIPPVLSLNGCYLRTKVEDLTCKSALRCVAIVKNKDSLCKFTSPNSTSSRFYLRNLDPRRSLVVSYKQIIEHVNQTKPDDVSFNIATIPSDPDSKLECEITSGPEVEKFNRHRYQILSACFEGHCPAPITNKPPVIRPDNADCEQLCDRSDPTCISYRLGFDPTEIALAKELTVLNRTLSSVSPPAGQAVDVDTSALQKIFESQPGATCNRSALNISREVAPGDMKFLSSGESCPIAFKVGNLNIEYAEISWPGVFDGRFKNGNGIYRFATIDAISSPTMYIDTSAGDEYYESIERITGRANALTFWGSTLYCAQLRWTPARDATQPTSYHR